MFCFMPLPRPFRLLRFGCIPKHAVDGQGEEWNNSGQCSSIKCIHPCNTQNSEVAFLHLFTGLFRKDYPSQVKMHCSYVVQKQTPTPPLYSRYKRDLFINQKKKKKKITFYTLCSSSSSTLSFYLIPEYI